MDDVIKRLTEERDEAIEKLEALREHITGKLTYATQEDPEHPDFDQLDAEDSVDAAAEELRDLRKELDEARAEVERLRERLPVDGSHMPSIVDTLEDENVSLRAQIERLRGVLHVVSLDEYESTTSASEKVHAHARQARIVLNETLAGVTPSDAAHVASLENLFLKACKRAEKWETASKEAYRRGAEAMREACAAALMADGLVLSRERAANVVRALPIPEEQ